jgi:hypothetical protein
MADENNAHGDSPVSFRTNKMPGVKNQIPFSTSTKVSKRLQPRSAVWDRDLLVMSQEK